MGRAWRYPVVTLSEERLESSGTEDATVPNLPSARVEHAERQRAAGEDVPRLLPDDTSTTSETSRS